MSVEALEKEALALPPSGRALLVDKLLASLAGEVNADVERNNLAEVKRGRFAIRYGDTTLVDGEESLRRARAAVRK